MKGVRFGIDSAAVTQDTFGPEETNRCDGGESLVHGIFFPVLFMMYVTNSPLASCDALSKAISERHTMDRRRMVLSLPIAAMVLGLAGTGWSQTAKKAAAVASQEEHKATPTRGYLSQLPPPGLRFAAPPKPPVAYLPPLPITYDPQPVFSSEFAPPTTDLPSPRMAVPASSDPPALSVPFAALTSNFNTNRTGSIPSGPVDMASVSPQMLVRFFQSGKPRDIELLLTNAVSFRVPVQDEKKSSSASYEVR